VSLLVERRLRIQSTVPLCIRETLVVEVGRYLSLSLRVLPSTFHPTYHQSFFVKFSSQIDILVHSSTHIPLHPPNHTTTTSTMQFSLAAVLALAATSATATYVPSYNGTSIVAPYPHLPTGTGSPVVSGTAAPTVPVPTSTFSTMPFEGAASKQAGSVLAIVIAGGVAIVSLHESTIR
jgi:hypothetical protein